MGRYTNLGPTEKAITDEQIASLYQEGLTYADIETVFGVSQRHTVKTIAYEFGINQTTVSSIVNQHGGRRFVLRQYKETDQ